jgi:PAS domain S-box-containing protein
MEDNSFLQAQLLATLENIPDLVALSNPDKKLTFINKAGREMLGFSPGENISNYSIFESHPAPVCDFLIKKAFPDALRDGVWSGETIIKNRNGQEFPVSQVIVAHRDAAGEIDFFSTIIRNIAAHRSMEEALFNSQQMLRMVLDTIPQRVFWKDRNSVFLGSNIPLAKDAGYADPSELIGKTDYDTASAETADLYRADDRKVMETGQPKLNYEEPQIKPDGSQAWLMTSKIPLRDKSGLIIGVLGIYEDITARKQVEIELRRALDRIVLSNLKWEKTFNSMSDGVALLSPDWEILNINEPFCAMLGRQRIDLIGKRCFDAVHAREMPLPGCPCTAVKESKKKVEVEIYEERLKLWLSVSVSPVLDQDGSIQYMIHVVRDITDRKSMEVKLRNQDQELRMVMNGMPVAQFVIGSDHRVRYWNKALEEISGFRGEDIVGTDQQWKAFYAEARPCLADLLVDGSYDKIPEYYQNKYKKSAMIKDAYEATDFFPMAAHGGKWLSFSAAAIRDRDGKIIGAVETLEDITERKEAQDKLAASEEQYHTLVDNLNVGIYRNTLGADGRFIQANFAMAQIFGYDSVDEFLKVKGISLYVNPDDRKKYLEAITKSGSVVNNEFFLKKRTGDPVWVSVSSHAHFDAQGAVDWIDGAVEDITEHKLEAEREAKLKTSLELSWGLAKMQDKPVQELSHYVLDGIKRISYSKYAFYGFMNDDESEMTIFAWSQETMQECALHDKPLVFSVAKSGIWADAVRKRHSIIVNEYNLDFEGKKGMPQGHVALTRVLSVPVFRKGKIVAVGAVANKETEYTLDDLHQLESFLDNAQIIAGRKKTEEALRNSESRYRELVGNMSSGVVVYDAVNNGEDFIIKDFNHAAERIEQVKKDALLGKSILDVFPGVRDFGIFDALKRVWNSGNSEFLPVNLYKDQRITGWRENYLYKLPSGEVVAVYEDVTERKMAEEERDRLFNLSIDMMAVAGFDGYFKQVNPSWTRILGWTAEEMTSKPYLEFVHPDDIKITIEAGEQLKQSRSLFAFKNRYKKKDGTYLWLSWNSFPYTEQKIILAIARDVTAEQKIQDALKSSELRYRMLFEAAKDGILIIDGGSGRIVDINPYLADLLGRPVEYFLDKEIWELGFLSDKVASKEAFLKLQTEGYVHFENMPLRKMNGEKLEVEFISNVYEVNGKKTIQCNIRDITERIKAQEHIRRLNLELEERVRQRTAQLESSMKELDSFSYSVSHDLQAPLRAIDGYSHIILEDHAAKLDEEGKKQFDRISANVRKMGRLINDLLSLSRLDRKKINFEDIDMDKLVRRCIEELKPSYADREIAFVIKDLVAGHGDESLVHEAIVNLFSNAIKFTRPRAKAIIEIGSYEKDSVRVYYVKDNGVGFNMAYVGNIFKEFVRLHHESEFEGTGIGLSIVQRIVSRHGGKVWAEGEIDKGATISFTLGKTW